MMADFLNNLEDRLFGRRMSTWLRPLIAVGVLLGSAYLGPRASVQLIILIIAAAILVLLMRAPMTGIFFLVVGSLLVPFELGTGTHSSINISMIIISAMLGLWILEMIIQHHRIWIYPSRVLPPLFGLVIVVTLSFLAGQLPWFAFANQVSMAAQLGGLMLFILSAGAFLWVSQHINNVKWLEWLVWSFLAVGSVYVFARLVSLPVVVNIFQLDATGAVFWVWIVALSSSQAIFNYKLSGRVRILLGVLTAAALVVGLTNRSWASGWAPAGVAFVTIVFFLNWRLGLLSVAVFTMAFIYVNADASIVDFSNDAYSLFTRQEAWKIVLGEIFRINPLLGLGPSNYYNYTPLFPILGYNVRFNSHNQYVDLLAQTGLLGALMFLWFAFETGWLALRLINRAQPGFPKAYSIGALGGLAGILVAGLLGDWIIPFVYNVGLGGFRSSVFAWVFLGGLVVIERGLEQNNNSSTR